ncbi:unnamed protein product [Cuscuta campestris]|uniref:Uncharacterized protein n=1 Tax=Cuscuta campestris TaxID=132261 RepID=A0A484NGY0_9ASTE|nr:unnamed protein product [Cuscuta campestris]
MIETITITEEAGGIVQFLGASPQGLEGTRDATRQVCLLLGIEEEATLEVFLQCQGSATDGMVLILIGAVDVFGTAPLPPPPPPFPLPLLLGLQEVFHLQCQGRATDGMVFVLIDVVDVFGTVPLTLLVGLQEVFRLQW